MESSQQQRENRTNTLSEEHVQSAIETVLANRVQTYEEFMSAFTVLTPDDVNQFSARRSNQRVEGQVATPEGSQVTSQIFQMSSSSPTPPNQQGRGVQQVEELEIEELGEDFINEKEPISSDVQRKSTKYTKVDNYLDEPDSESELLSDDEEINFDDSSTNYVASFDTQTEAEREAAKSVPPTVTPEMVEKVNEGDSVSETSVQEISETTGRLSALDLYPGEVDAAEDTSSSPYHTVHITQLPSATVTDPPIGTDVAEGSTKVSVPLDDVQPFSIDPDFDYDNVILTPKWAPGHGPPSGFMPSGS
ncbi:intraflagellar transport-associated protein-like [Lytechinus variegatus]|uniref:intraflagellar transport-associated protein-like n=1 Tax=Lytechinus variegatus TaxID=7654 RepID=UPI001BB14F56|nr:intraflagellar transport-associated protein-like [Lytechinus variegatus]